MVTIEKTIQRVLGEYGITSFYVEITKDFEDCFGQYGPIFTLEEIQNGVLAYLAGWDEKTRITVQNAEKFFEAVGSPQLSDKFPNWYFNLIEIEFENNRFVANKKGKKQINHLMKNNLKKDASILQKEFSEEQINAYLLTNVFDSEAAFEQIKRTMYRLLYELETSPEVDACLKQVSDKIKQAIKREYEQRQI